MKHIIWDFNGTLLSDLQLSVDCDNHVFRQLGIPEITKDIYRCNMTMPVRDFYTAIGVDFAVHPYELISTIWLNEFNQKVIEAGLMPDALKTVQRLYDCGITQSVLSASFEPSLRSQCEALGIASYMTAIDGQENENAEKKSEIGKRHIRHIGLDPQEVLLIGDMVTDSELSEELGVNCILVNWGHNDLQRLVKTGRPVASSFQELEKWILQKAGICEAGRA